jgi:putative transposase
MDKELRERIALFRFGLISNLVNQKGISRGEQELRIRQITSKNWAIPGSPRSSIARSTVLRWVSVYQRSGFRLESLQPQPRKDRGVGRALSAETETSPLPLHHRP